MKKENSTTNRAQFSSGIAVFFATLSSAVGLGNIWRFPYMLGENGGGSFLFLYLLCIMFVGMPLLIFEFYMGRRSRKNVVGAFRTLSNSKKWEKVGLVSCLGSFCQLFFYTTVSGWIYSYVFKGFRGDFIGVTNDTAKTHFLGVVNTPAWALLWQFIVISIVTGILILGVKNGIEKITKTLMPVLFGLIVFCVIKALMLPGAMDGVKTLFSIDFSKITMSAVLFALGLSFFKLALGSGAMVTYGSYFTEDNNIVSTTIKLILADTAVSVLVALIIFPALSSFGLDMTEGKGLLFAVMPIVFANMNFGRTLLIIFFTLTSIAATCSMLAVFEVPVAYFSEEKNMSRTKAVLLVSSIVLAFGALATLSAHPDALVKIPFFPIFDFASSNVIFPIAGLCTSLFIGYYTKKEELFDELTNHGVLKNEKIINFFYYLVKYVTPILLSIVFINLILSSVMRFIK